MRYFIIILMCSSLVACKARDENYYQQNPEQLHLDLENCKEQSPKGVTCNELGAIAAKMNLLSFELRRNPQEFGITILKLQEDIAKDRAKLKAQDKNKDLIISIKQQESLLQAKLAVVKWLESPR